MVGNGILPRASYAAPCSGGYSHTCFSKSSPADISQRIFFFLQISALWEAERESPLFHSPTATEQTFPSSCPTVPPVPGLAGFSGAVLPIPPEALQVLSSDGGWAVSPVGSTGPWDSGSCLCSTYCRHRPLRTTVLTSRR